MAKHQPRQLPKGLITEGQLRVIKATQLTHSVQNIPCVASVTGPGPGSPQIWSRGEYQWQAAAGARNPLTSVAVGNPLPLVGFTGFWKMHQHHLHYVSWEVRFLFPKNLWKLRWREKSFHFTAKSYKYPKFPAAEQGKFHWGSGGSC